MVTNTFTVCTKQNEVMFINYICTIYLVKIRMMTDTYIIIHVQY